MFRKYYPPKQCRDVSFLTKDLYDITSEKQVASVSRTLVLKKSGSICNDHTLFHIKSKDMCFGIYLMGKLVLLKNKEKHI